MNMLIHWPIYQVVLPILIAFAMFFTPVRLCHYLAIISAILCSLVNIYGLSVLDGELRYYLGGWAAPVGIEYRLDYLNQPLLLILSLILVYMLSNAKSVIDSLCGYDIDDRNKLSGKQNLRLFYFLLLILHAGLSGIAATNDLFNLYVFIEIASLTTYALLAMSEDNRALIGSLNYLIIGTIGASFILLGIGLILVTTGTLNIDDAASRMQQVRESRITILGIFSFTLGCLLKMALFPLHGWMIRAYRFASTSLLTYIAPASALVSAYMLMRFIYFVCDINYLYNVLYFGQIMAVLGIIAASIASYYALKAKNVRDIVLYSSAAQIGYLAISFSVNNAEMLGVIVSFILADILVKISLFTIVGAAEKMNKESFEESDQYPSKSFMFISFLVILSNAAVPLSTGFVNKMNIIAILMEHSYYLPAAMVVAMSILALEYNYKLLREIYVARVKKAYLLALWPALASYVLLYNNQKIIKIISQLVN